MRLGAKVGGRYRLTKGPIHGGTGEVWCAHDDELGRDVVLKRVRGVDGTTGFDRLRAEARVLARFSHPHVVTLHDAVRVGRRTRATSWLVMEYAPGGSLDHRPVLPPRLAAHVGAQIADALIALHAKGIVHGDIKPGNVVVTREDTAKLADFGAAYRVGGKETITPNSAIGYTPDFAAPEVVRGRPEPASDVFSLAAMVYALTTGHPPRHAAAGGAYIAAREAARGAELDADTGPLGEVLAAMLHREPGRRPTAEEARERLRTIAGPVRELPPLPDRLEPTGEDARSFPSEGRGGRGDFSGSTGVSGLGEPGGFGGRDRVPAGGPRAFVRRHLRPVIAISTAVAVLALAAGAWAVARDPGGKSGDAHAAADRTSHSPAPTGASAATSAVPNVPKASAGPAASLFGDHRTADPCALTEPSALATYGDAELDIAYGDFDRCDVIVDSNAGPEIDVEVDFVGGPAPQLSVPAQNIGRVGVVKEPADGGECDRTLLITGEAAVRGDDGDAHVVITAKPEDDSDPAPSLLCRMADTATTAAVAALNAVPSGGQLPRRTPPLPADSLIHKDACTLLTAPALEVVPGIDANDPDIDFGHWGCSWGSTTSDTYVDLHFDRGEPLTAEDGTPTRLGGHRAFIAPPDEEGDHTAEVFVVHRTYTAQHGERQVETLDLVVGGSRSDAQLRTMATQLAAAAAAQLSAT